MTPESTIDEELHRLRNDIGRLNDIVAPLLQSVRLDALGDDMGAMAFCFVNKQIEHIKSICVLMDNQKYRDAWAISRIMFEGGVFLNWANKDPTHKRAYNWRSYWHVGHFRQWYGKPEYLLHKREIEFNLRTHCTQFLHKKAKRKTQDKITPDDYHKQWYVPFQPKTIINETEFGPLYYPTYTLTSGWLHWDSFMVGQALKSEGIYTDYTNETKWIGILAYTNGYFSLILSAKILDDVFDLQSQDLQAELNYAMEKMQENEFFHSSSKSGELNDNRSDCCSEFD